MENQIHLLCPSCYSYVNIEKFDNKIKVTCSKCEFECWIGELGTQREDKDV